MTTNGVIEWLAAKYRDLGDSFNERARRRWAAVEATSLGRGGISAVAEATGLSRTTIYAGIREVHIGKELPAERVRRPGGGRKPCATKDPGLVAALEALIEDSTRGDPESPLRWTCKSVRRLAEELQTAGHAVAFRTVASLLHASGYSLQSNRKTQEGTHHPDRDAQFRYINRLVKAFQRRGQPVISVDTKKKELVGNFKNGGREWHPQGQPVEVQIHDFQDPELGKAIPYGVYDVTHNEGWVSVGVNHDTAEFAVEAIARWWHKMGRRRFPRSRELLITADSGGSNGYRSRLWKCSLQALADRTGLRLSVCHFPPGTSKWNKIEHRLFCHITQNWRGKPLLTHQVIVALIAGTRTIQGLRVRAQLDRHTYEAGIKISDEEIQDVNLVPAKFHGDWNYGILPAKT